MSLAEQAVELRQAFQDGNDERMLAILNDEGMLEKLLATVQYASDRSLTYSAPYIADLAKRIGPLEGA